MKWIVYQRLNYYAIALVEKETAKSYIINKHGNIEFMAMESQVSKNHVIWETEHIEAARAVKNTIINAGSDRRRAISKAEEDYKNLIEHSLLSYEGKSL